jgi:hypothetical protein
MIVLAAEWVSEPLLVEIASVPAEIVVPPV